MQTDSNYITSVSVLQHVQYIQLEINFKDRLVPKDSYTYAFIFNFGLISIVFSRILIFSYIKHPKWLKVFCHEPVKEASAITYTVLLFASAPAIIVARGFRWSVVAPCDRALYQSPHTSLDRRGRKLQLRWCAEACNHKVVIPVLYLFYSWLIAEVLKMNEMDSITVLPARDLFKSNLKRRRCLINMSYANDYVWEREGGYMNVRLRQQPSAPIS